MARYFIFSVHNIIGFGESTFDIIAICALALSFTGMQALAQAPSPNENFVRTEIVRVSGKTTDAAVLALTSDQKQTAYQYMDGIGRPLQSNFLQGSPAKKDMVHPTYYDALGKPIRAYLPYRASTNNGSYQSSALTAQASFYATPPTGVPTDAKAYSASTFEASPLNRILSSTNVGNDYQSKTVTSRFKVNDASLIRRWTVTSGLPRSTTTYPAGSLSISENTDEAGAISRIYQDVTGKTILQQVQSGATTWLNTYYVYSDYNELLFVIPPAASANLTPDAAYTNLWCVQYEYDNLGRQIGYKAPGASWEYTIYDQWDRPVLSQNGVQRANTTPEWSYIKYDGLNRPVVSGTLATTSTRSSLTTAVAAATVRDEQRSSTSTVGYTLNRTYPTTATEADIIAVTYYDDYAFLSITGWSPNNSLYNYVAETGFSGTKATEVKGLLTGTKTKTQGATTATWLYSVAYYDKYYQPLQSISSHQQGGTVKTVSQFAFSGEVEKTVNIYTYTGGTTRVQRRYTYDHMGRILKAYHQVNTLPEVLLSEVTYNELGQPYKSKHHSRNNGSTYLYQGITDYAVQGWTKKTQYQFSNGDNIFTQELGYHNILGSGNIARYDGMISGHRWKHGTTEAEGAYNYTYNTPKMLTQSAYTQKASGASTWTANNFFTENNIQYDANGNITSLIRNQEKTSAAAQIDNLAYTYSGNALTTVADNAPAANKASGFADGNTVGTDYTYNENGDLKADKNKGIISIAYNKLGLPERVDFASGANIRYTYSASGGLLTTSYHSTASGAATRTVQRVGELVFENNGLVDIYHEFGRVRANADNKYQYYLTDYLGSTRVVLQEDPGQFTSIATFEPELAESESQQFLNYDEAAKISAFVFDHTDSAESRYSVRLAAGSGEGPAKSISVMTGDTVRMEAFGKFVGLEKKQDPKVLALLLGAAGATTGIVGGEVSGALPQSTSGQTGLAALMGAKNETGDAPPAYLNYLFFDREMNYKYGGFVQMTEAAREDGTDVPHERLTQEVIAQEPGYFYVYLSNEGLKGDEAYFDDFSVTVSESFIVQTTDYYPYGMVAKNWVRVGEKETKDLFQGKTYEDLTKWYDFHARQYDAEVGRFLGMDPRNQFASPYLAMGNNPVMMVDPDGELAWFVPVIIGAVVNVAVNAKNIDNGWDVLGYAAVGAASGYLGGAIAGANIAFSNTLALAASSTLNSTGNYMVSGGKGDIITSFGAFSLNWSQVDVGYLGEKGNSTLENIGYGFGALANIQDIAAGFHGTTVDVKSRPKLAGHSETSGSYNGNDITISVGPADHTIGQGNGLKWEMAYVKRTLQGNSVAGENVSYIQSHHPQIVTKLNNVNGKWLQSMTQRLNAGQNLLNTGTLKYGLLYGCVNYNARALLFSGVLNVNAFLPVSAPVLLNAELALRQIGIYASPYLTTYR